MVPKQPILEVDALSLAEQCRKGAEVTFVDVREAWEHDMGMIKGALPLPLSALPEALTRLNMPKDAHIITYCHHGMRSLKAASLMLDHGYAHVTSLAGGIDAWAVHIDPTLRRY